MTTGEARHVPEGARDLTLEKGCLVCGGDLSLRVTHGLARTFCRACGWLSRPQIVREGEKVHFLHPTGVA